MAVSGHLFLSVAFSLRWFSNFALCMHIMPLQVTAVGKHFWGSRTAACSICSGTSCFTVSCLQVADFEEHEYDSRTGLDKERISRHLGNRVSPSCIPALLQTNSPTDCMPARFTFAHSLLQVARPAASASCVLWPCSCQEHTASTATGHQVPAC